MPTCEVCGNEYDKAMEITQNGRVHVFDCFECAIHALAPSCAHCGCRIVGHGMEHAKEMRVRQRRDRGVRVHSIGMAVAHRAERAATPAATNQR